MKKLLLAVLIAVAAGTSAFAADASKVSYKVKTSFEAQFYGAKDVSWNVTPDYTRFVFTLADEKIEAFYNSDGEQIGVSRKIEFKGLPLAAIQKIQKNYADYTVKETIEFDQNGDKHYYVSLENGNQKKVLEVSLYGNVSVFQPGKK